MDREERDGDERSAGSTPAGYLPRQVAELLGVPPSTLRLYAARFDALLSATARRDRCEPGPPYRHRRYTLADVAVLERAKRLVEAGLSYEQARRQLSGEAADLAVIPTRRQLAYRRPSPANPGSPSGSPARARDKLTQPDALSGVASNAASSLAALLERVAMMESLLQAQHQLAASLDRRLGAIEERITRIERALADEGSAPEPGRRRGWLGRMLRGERGAP